MRNAAIRWKQLLRFGVSAGLLLMLAAGAAVAQQAHPGTAKPVQHHRVRARRHHHRRKATAAAQVRVEVYNGSKTQTQVFDDASAARARHAKSDASLTRVDVINGSQKQMQVFNAEQALGAHAAGKRSRGRSQRNVAEANYSDVEIFNGTTKQRRVFMHEGSSSAGKAPTLAQPGTAPVVVGIAATGAEPRETNAPRVVTGITSGSSASTDRAEPGPARVSPLPARRPEYVPAPQDAPQE